MYKSKYELKYLTLEQLMERLVGESLYEELKHNDIRKALNNLDFNRMSNVICCMQQKHR